MNGGMNTQLARFYERFQLSPTIVFGESFVTRQVALDTVAAVRVIERGNAKMFMLATTDAALIAFLGNAAVTPTSGFALIPQMSPLVFAMAENAELWAIGSGTLTLFVMDMGL